MILIHGVYHFLPRRTGFRNDFCLSCNAPRRALQVRTLDLLHIFWIPVLPIGLWKRWFCAVCGKRPGASIKTRRSYKIAGLAILVVFSLAFWSIPIDRDEEALFWAFRIAAPIGALATLVHLLRTGADPSYKSHLRAVSPADDFMCPFCNVPLANLPNWHCQSCKVRRL